MRLCKHLYRKNGPRKYIFLKVPTSMHLFLECTHIQRVKETKELKISNFPMFQSICSPDVFKRFATEASFSLASLKIDEKAFLRTIVLNHRSLQNLNLMPSPNTKLVWLKNFSHPSRIYLHKPTPFTPLTSLVH